MCYGERPGPRPRALLYTLCVAVQVSIGIPGWDTRRGAWCSQWSTKVCMCDSSPRLRCLLQAPTTDVAGAAEVWTLRQDRAHATRDEAFEPAPAKKFAQPDPRGCWSAKKFAQHGAFSGLSAKKLAQHHPSSSTSAKKLAQQAKKRRNWGVFSALGELFRARTHIKPRGANFFALTPTIRARGANEFAHGTQRRGNFETNDTTAPADAGHRETTITTARPRTATVETDNTSATEKRTKYTHFTSAKATPVSTDPPHRPAVATLVSVEARPARAKATAVSDNRTPG